MKQIFIHGITGNNNQIFDPELRDGSSDPWIYLRERLLVIGYHLVTADNLCLDDCERVIFFEGASVRPYTGLKGFARKLKAMVNGTSLVRNLYSECVNARMTDKIALFLWEPPSVIPQNWKAGLHELFPLIFTWHDEYVDGEKVIKIHWPQARNFPTLPEVSFADKKLLVNISMNKFSRHPNELYSARRDAIYHFERTQPDHFDLYGVGWNKPVRFIERINPGSVHQFSSYRGVVRHKWDVLPQYRFSLCYENIHDEPGFITEKIFDCMRCHCVPIYWGAPNIEKYVDEGAFIDRRNFKSDAELESFLTGMTESQYTEYVTAIDGFLLSDRFEKFLPQAFAETVIEALQLNRQI